MNARPVHRVIHRTPGVCDLGVIFAVSWLQVLTDLGYAGDKVSTTLLPWMMVQVASPQCTTMRKDLDAASVCKQNLSCCRPT